MARIDMWDVVIVAAAAMTAVGTLVRLMRARRDLLVAQVQQQVAAERQRQNRAEKKRKKREAEAARRAA